MSEELDDLVVTLRARNLYAEADAIARFRADLAAAQARVAEVSAERDAAKKELSRIAVRIEQQVQTTRDYAKDSAMDRHQLSLMGICTGHFLDEARAIRALASEATPADIAGQNPGRSGGRHNPELFSEDLW